MAPAWPAEGDLRVMMRSGLACLFITSSAVAAAMTVAPQPLNGGETSKIAQLAMPRAAGEKGVHTTDEAAYLAAQAWLVHIAPRRRWP